ncbi:MAG: hypothetical protein ACRD50_03925 [Candidatus Acidiferrales bacterium]
MWKKILVGVLVLLIAAFGFLSYMMGSPRDAYGFLRYALPHWHRGDLQVGDSAPDVRLVALDGSTPVRLRDSIGGRPLVLILGSYT